MSGIRALRAVGRVECFDARTGNGFRGAVPFRERTPSSSVRELVKHMFEDRYIPYNGEIILVRLS
jgi:hypothetical protein